MGDKNNKTYGISLPKAVIDDIKARKLVASEVIRNSFLIARLEPKYLYEVSMVKEDSFYYVIVDKCSDTSVIREMMRFDYFNQGAKVHGIGEYSIRLVGCFPNISDAKLYSEFLMNKCLDKGCYLVNEYFQRYISLRMDLSRISAVIPSDVDLSILVEEVIKILESSNRSSFNDKLDDSLNKISKRIRKRIRI